MQKPFETMQYENTQLVLTAKFDSAIISLRDAAAFFKFLSDSFDASLEYHHPHSELHGKRPTITTNVSVESGSIKAVIQIIKSRDYQVGVFASISAAIIWAAATYTWPENVEVNTNVPRQKTSYRVPIDPQLSKMVNSLNATQKPWSLEISSKQEDHNHELKITIKANQGSR